MAYYDKEEKNTQTDSSFLSHLPLKDLLPNRESVNFVV